MRRSAPRRSTTSTSRSPRRALVASAVVAACAVGTLGVAAPAGAATSLQIEDGTLQVLGDNANNKVAVFNGATAFAIDVGADGSAEFTADRSAFTKVEVQGRGGDDEL